ncbi:MAG: hypothetical protein U0R44_03185 [Candidatus Micrarchaeia archaeon]
MRSALVLLLVLGLSSAASCLLNATSVIVSEQGSLIGIVIAFLILVLAVAYAAGNATHNPSFIVFAKDEFYHLMFSIMLLVGFSGILVFSCQLTGFFFDQTFSRLGTTTCYSPGLNVNGIAECYIKNAQEDARSMSERYVQKYIDQMMDSTFAVSLQIPLFNAFTATTGAFRKVISSQYNMIFSSFLVPALMSLSMQKFFLQFVNENVVRWVLPIAVLLRFFPPTRHMGNIFIALVIGLYVLLPLLYAFNGAMYDVVAGDCNSFSKAACDNAIDNNGCPSIQNPASSGAATCSNPDSLWNVARLIPQAFFLPNLTLALLITFFGSIHKALRVIG